MARQEITIQTIAELCGVSCGTVSRAIARPEMVAAKTREKILKVIQEYNYSPNPLARAMINKRSNIISVVAPDAGFNYQSELISGCSEALYDRGYCLLALDNSLYNKRTTDYIRVLKQQICDGTILFFENNDQPIEALASSQPVVSFEYYSNTQGVYSVCTDLDDAFEVLINYLYRLNGHTRIALVAGRSGDYMTKRIIDGYKAGMESHLLPFRQDFIYCCDWTIQQGYESLNYFYSLDVPPTAIIYYSSSLAQGALAACYEHGLCVPNDLSLATLDGAAINRFLTPGITTLNYDVAGIGKILASTILSCIEKQTTPQQKRTVKASGVCTGASVKRL